MHNIEEKKLRLNDTAVGQVKDRFATNNQTCFILFLASKLFEKLSVWILRYPSQTQYGSKLAILLLPWLFQVVRYISLLFFIRENLPKESHRSRASRFPILDSDRTFQNFRSPFVDPRFFNYTKLANQGKLKALKL